MQHNLPKLPTTIRQRYGLVLVISLVCLITTVTILTTQEGNAQSLSEEGDYILSMEDNPPLPIPTLMRGQMVNGFREYNLTMRQGMTEFLDDIDTPTKGYNGSYLGPTLLLKKNELVSINVTNRTGIETTTHWHGLHLPAEEDGGPHQTFGDNETWTASFQVLNRASTNWYHPHPHTTDGITGETGTGGQVYSGLAGMIIVEDQVGEQLDIPNRYGVDDIPLIIQDRAFEEDGSFAQFWNDGFFRKGDMMLVNGAIEPRLDTYAQLIRFRVLNGSNARIYNLGLSDNQTFYQIASDGGFLEEPVELTRLILAPGERAEIIIDFKNDEDRIIDLVSFNAELGDRLVPDNQADLYDRENFRVMSFDVGRRNNNAVLNLPDSLVNIDRFQPAEAINEEQPRRFVLGESTINQQIMDMSRIDVVAGLDSIEVWEIENASSIAHPFHVHDDYFQILNRSGRQLEANEWGWKDTVLVEPGETVRIIRVFEDFMDLTTPYMFHCHILVHEDAGMMGQFAVATEYNHLPIIVVDSGRGYCIIQIGDELITVLLDDDNLQTMAL